MKEVFKEAEIKVSGDEVITVQEGDGFTLKSKEALAEVFREHGCAEDESVYANGMGVVGEISGSNFIYLRAEIPLESILETRRVVGGEKCAHCERTAGWYVQSPGRKENVCWQHLRRGKKEVKKKTQEGYLW